MFYRRDGSQFDDLSGAALEWARLFHDPAYKIVRQTRLPHGEKWVSTVWLGLDHNFGFGVPLIFETMVFGRKDLRRMSLGGRTITTHNDYAQERWASEAEAIAGHAALCRYWRQNRKQRRRWKILEES